MIQFLTLHAGETMQFEGVLVAKGFKTLTM